MKRITLIFTAIAIVAAMVALNALPGVAQTDSVLDTGGSDQYEDDGALDTGGSDQYEDDGALDTGGSDDGALDTGGSDDGSLDTGGDDAEEPGSEVEEDPDPICAPGWYREWYQWYTPDWAWWYFWWFQWCHTEDDGWYRDYDSWEWWGPIG